MAFVAQFWDLEAALKLHVLFAHAFHCEANDEDLKGSANLRSKYFYTEIGTYSYLDCWWLLS